MSIYGAQLLVPNSVEILVELNKHRLLVYLVVVELASTRTSEISVTLVTKHSGCGG